MTFPISRQGLEQIAIVLAVGGVLFGLLALIRWRRGDDWRRFAQNPTPDTPATVAAGRALFAANCVICHGPQGLGDGPAAFTLQPRPFNLQVHVPQHAPGELFYWISEGIPSTAMPAWSVIDPATGKPKLSDTERWEIIRFLQALAAGKAT